jgi:hypothetical protein
MVILTHKKIPGNNSGLTKIEVMLGCAVQSGVRKKVQLQNGVNI